jgi:hypothetical protein
VLPNQIILDISCMVTANTGAVNYDDSAAADFVINGSITSSTQKMVMLFLVLLLELKLTSTAGDSDTTNGSWSSIVNLGLTGTATFFTI